MDLVDVTDDGDIIQGPVTCSHLLLRQISSVLPVMLPFHTALLLRLRSGIIFSNSIKH